MTCPSGRSYIIKSGDTLFLIAQRELGDGNRWQEIKKPDGTPFTEEEAQHLWVGQEVCLLEGGTVPSNIEEILAAHNKYRGEVGAPPLTWSDTLAQSAQQWANHLATSVHTLQHSGQQGVGENLAAASPPGSETLSQMVDQWGAEQADFTPGIFSPNVAKDKSWENVGHYTQVIWRATTQVGCGFATDTNGIWDYLVCQYTPPGNVLGEQVP